jgi:hypothetical protein
MIKDEYEKDFEFIEKEDIEREPFELWKKRQRELVTSVLDYNLSSLNDLIQTNIIELSPSYQRRCRWTDDQQSKLIESFLMNVPVPPIFLNEDDLGKYSIIDGKQRLTTVSRFFTNKLKLQNLEIFADINGKYFSDLPINLNTILKTRVTLRAIIILKQSDPLIKYEVFRRLNTGGVELNAQEIRNSVYPGPFNNLLIKLSTEKKFHQLLGVKQKEKSAIYKEMRDVELVLRYFTFKDNWYDFSGGMRRYLDMYMENGKKFSKIDLENMRKDFLKTLEIVEACFGENAFQRWNPEREQWRQLVLASLYDAQMFACRGLELERVRLKHSELVKGLQKLFLDPEFRKTIDSATNTPSSFKKRIFMMKEMIDNTLNH